MSNAVPKESQSKEEKSEGVKQLDAFRIRLEKIKEVEDILSLKAVGKITTENKDKIYSYIDDNSPPDETFKQYMDTTYGDNILTAEIAAAKTDFFYEIRKAAGEKFKELSTSLKITIVDLNKVILNKIEHSLTTTTTTTDKTPAPNCYANILTNVKGYSYTITGTTLTATTSSEHSLNQNDIICVFSLFYTLLVNAKSYNLTGGKRKTRKKIQRGGVKLETIINYFDNIKAAYEAMKAEEERKAKEEEARKLAETTSKEEEEEEAVPGLIEVSDYKFILSNVLFIYHIANADKNCSEIQNMCTKITEQLDNPNMDELKGIFAPIIMKFSTKEGEEGEKPCDEETTECIKSLCQDLLEQIYEDANEVEEQVNIEQIITDIKKGTDVVIPTFTGTQYKYIIDKIFKAEKEETPYSTPKTTSNKKFSMWWLLIFLAASFIPTVHATTNSSALVLTKTAPTFSQVFGVVMPAYQPPFELVETPAIEALNWGLMQNQYNTQVFSSDGTDIDISSNSYEVALDYGWKESLEIINKELLEKNRTLTDEVSTLTEKQSELEGNISEQTETIATAQAENAELQTKISTLESGTGELQGKVSASEFALKEKESQLLSSKTALEEAQKQLTDATSRESQITSELETAKQSLEKAQTDMAASSEKSQQEKTGLEQQIKINKETVSRLEGEKTSVETKVKELTGKINAKSEENAQLTIQIESAKKENTQLKETNASNQEQIQTLQSEQAINAKRLQTQSDALKTAQTTIAEKDAALEQAVKTLKEKESALLTASESEKAVLQSQIDQEKSTVSALTSEKTAQEEKMKGLQSQFEESTTKNTELNKTIENLTSENTAQKETVKSLTSQLEANAKKITEAESALTASKNEKIEVDAKVVELGKELEEAKRASAAASTALTTATEEFEKDKSALKQKVLEAETKNKKLQSELTTIQMTLETKRAELVTSLTKNHELSKEKLEKINNLNEEIEKLKDESDAQLESHKETTTQLQNANAVLSHKTSLTETQLIAEIEKNDKLQENYKNQIALLTSSNTSSIALKDSEILAVQEAKTALEESNRELLQQIETNAIANASELGNLKEQLFASTLLVETTKQTLAQQIESNKIAHEELIAKHEAQTLELEELKERIADEKRVSEEKLKLQLQEQEQQNRNREVSEAQNRLNKNEIDRLKAKIEELTLAQVVVAKAVEVLSSHTESLALALALSANKIISGKSTTPMEVVNPILSKSYPVKPPKPQTSTDKTDKFGEVKNFVKFLYLYMVVERYKNINPKKPCNILVVDGIKESLDKIETHPVVEVTDEKSVKEFTKLFDLVSFLKASFLESTSGSSTKVGGSVEVPDYDAFNFLFEEFKKVAEKSKYGVKNVSNSISKYIGDVPENFNETDVDSQILIDKADSIGNNTFIEDYNRYLNKEFGLTDANSDIVAGENYIKFKDFVQKTPTPTEESVIKTRVTSLKTHVDTHVDTETNKSYPSNLNIYMQFYTWESGRFVPILQNVYAEYVKTLMETTKKALVDNKVDTLNNSFTNLYGIYLCDLLKNVSHVKMETKVSPLTEVEEKNLEDDSVFSNILKLFTGKARGGSRRRKHRKFKKTRKMKMRKQVGGDFVSDALQSIKELLDKARLQVFAIAGFDPGDLVKVPVDMVSFACNYLYDLANDMLLLFTGYSIKSSPPPTPPTILPPTILPPTPPLPPTPELEQATALGLTLDAEATFKKTYGPLEPGITAKDLKYIEDVTVDDTKYDHKRVKQILDTWYDKKPFVLELSEGSIFNPFKEKAYSILRTFVENLDRKIKEENKKGAVQIIKPYTMSWQIFNDEDMTAQVNAFIDDNLKTFFTDLTTDNPVNTRYAIIYKIIKLKGSPPIPVSDIDKLAKLENTFDEFLKNKFVWDRKNTLLKRGSVDRDSKMKNFIKYNPLNEPTSTVKNVGDFFEEKSKIFTDSITKPVGSLMGSIKEKITSGGMVGGAIPKQSLINFLTFLLFTSEGVIPDDLQKIIEAAKQLTCFDKFKSWINDTTPSAFPKSKEKTIESVQYVLNKTGVSPTYIATLIANPSNTHRILFKNANFMNFIREKDIVRLYCGKDISCIHFKISPTNGLKYIMQNADIREKDKVGGSPEEDALAISLANTTTPRAPKEEGEEGEEELVEALGQADEEDILTKFLNDKMTDANIAINRNTFSRLNDEFVLGSEDYKADSRIVFFEEEFDPLFQYFHTYKYHFSRALWSGGWPEWEDLTRVMVEIIESKPELKTKFTKTLWYSLGGLEILQKMNPVFKEKARNVIKDKTQEKTSGELNTSAEASLPVKEEDNTSSPFITSLKKYLNTIKTGMNEVGSKISKTLNDNPIYNFNVAFDKCRVVRKLLNYYDIQPPKNCNYSMRREETYPKFMKRECMIAISVAIDILKSTAKTSSSYQYYRVETPLDKTPGVDLSKILEKARSEISIEKLKNNAYYNIDDNNSKFATLLNDLLSLNAVEEQIKGGQVGGNSTFFYNLNVIFKWTYKQMLERIKQNIVTFIDKSSVEIESIEETSNESGIIQVNDKPQNTLDCANLFFAQIARLTMKSPGVLCTIELKLPSHCYIANAMLIEMLFKLSLLTEGIDWNTTLNSSSGDIEELKKPGSNFLSRITNGWFTSKQGAQATIEDDKGRGLPSPTLDEKQIELNKLLNEAGNEDGIISLLNSLTSSDALELIKSKKLSSEQKARLTAIIPKLKIQITQRFDEDEEEDEEEEEEVEEEMEEEIEKLGLPISIITSAGKESSSKPSPPTDAVEYDGEKA